MRKDARKTEQTETEVKKRGKENEEGNGSGLEVRRLAQVCWGRVRVSCRVRESSGKTRVQKKVLEEVKLHDRRVLESRLGTYQIHIPHQALLVYV